MSADQLERAFDLLTAATEAGQIGAASLTVTRHGKEVFARGCGQQHPRTGQPVDADSIFLLASITKPVTACALMILVDRGLISLNDPAIDYLPEYTGGDRPAVKVRHLLSHISGMPDMLPENTSLRQARWLGQTPNVNSVASCSPIRWSPKEASCDGFPMRSQQQ